MDSLLAILSEQLGGDAIGQISRQIGADEEGTSKAISGALPMLMAALARNTQSEDGAAALSDALERDHDGSLLEDLGGFLERAETEPGDKILGHVIGNRRGSVESGLSRLSGLNMGSISKLLPILAPILLAALGRTKQRQGFDPGSLSDYLNTERRQVERSAPKEFGMLEMFLDRDGDGQIMDDVADIATSVLGNLFRPR